MFEHSELIWFVIILREETHRIFTFDSTVYFRVLENDRLSDHSLREFAYCTVAVNQSAFRGFETHRICDRSMRRNLSNLFSTARIVIECSELIEIPTAPKQALHVKHIYNSLIYSPRTRNLEGSNLLPHSIQSEVTENSVRVSWLCFFCLSSKSHTTALDLDRTFCI